MYENNNNNNPIKLSNQYLFVLTENLLGPGWSLSEDVDMMTGLESSTGLEELLSVEDTVVMVIG